MIRGLKRNALLAAVSAVALTPMANAQVFEQQGGGERRTIEVITVTAQQREQSLQDVPLSVGAYDAETLETAGVRDIKDLIAISPGLMVTSTQAETITTARIRGVGTVGDNFGLESSVGVYIDGVFRARNGVGFGDLGEIERVEVLRGPQGTLFGKNTSAGVLNIITKGPEFEPGGHADITWGDYNQLRYSAGVTGPIVEDTLAFRLYGVRGTRDGFTQLVRGQEPAAAVIDSESSDYYSMRGQLLYTPTENFELRVIADYSDRDELCCSAVQWDYTATAAALVGSENGAVLVPADPDERIAFSNRPYIQDVEDWGISAEAEVQFDFGTLTSITSFRNWRNMRSQDIDYSSLDLANRELENNFTDLERFSQEFRLNGVRGDLDWLVGIFYSEEDLRLGDALRFGDDWEPFLGRLLTASSVPPLGTPAGVAATLGQFAPLAPAAVGAGVPGASGVLAVPAPGTGLLGGGGPVQDLYDQSADSFAIYTHNTYQLTDRLALTGGLRFTMEDKSVLATFETAGTPACAALESAFGFDPIAGFAAAATFAGQDALIPLGAAAIGNICLPYARSGLDQTGYDQSRTDEELSGTIRLSYELSDDVLTYVGFSRGFKAGGFNLDRQFNGPIDPLLGYTNADTSFEPEFINAYEAGFKGQFFGNVIQLNGNAFYQDIEDFQLNTFNGLAFVVESVQEARSYGLEFDALYYPPIEGLTLTGGYAYVNSEYTDVDTGDPLVDAIEGKAFSLSPEHFITGTATYERDVFWGLVGLASIDFRWVSDYNTGSDLDPEKEQPSFTLVNARLGVRNEDNGLSLEVFGRNLTDETYAQVAFDAFAQGRRDGAGTSNDPRGTASYNAFLGAPRTWGVTLRKEW